MPSTLRVAGPIVVTIFVRRWLLIARSILSVGATVVGASLWSSGNGGSAGPGIATASNSPVRGVWVGSGPSSGSSSAPSASSSRCT